MGKVKSVIRGTVLILSCILVLGLMSSLFTDKTDAGCKHENVKLLEGYAQTCDKPGLTEGKMCMDCETIIVKQQEISAEGHHPIVSKEATPATCSKYGLTEETSCGTCGKVLVPQKSIMKLPHAEGYSVEAVPATCSVSGYTAGTRCKVCQGIIDGCEVVPTTEHKKDIVIQAISPTCTEYGWTEGKKCSICGGVSVKPNRVDALGHVANVLQEIAPTCDAAGLTEGLICERCDAVLVEQTEIPILQHNYDDGRITQTGSCFKDEITEYTCLYCFGKKQTVTAKATGHQFNANGVCSKCGESISTDGIISNGISVVLTGNGNASPNIVGVADVDMELLDSLQSNQVVGFAFVEYDDFEAISTKSKKVDWIKELEKAGKTVVFKEAENLGEYSIGFYTVTAELNITYKKVNTWYLALPVIRSSYSNGYSYQYASDICNMDETYRMSAVSAAAELLNLYAQGYDEPDIVFDNQMLQLLNNTIDMSVDLTRGLSSPVFDGSKYVLEEAVVRYELDGKNAVPTYLGTFAVGTKFEDSDRIWYESMNEKQDSVMITNGMAEIIFTCEFGAGAVQEDAKAMVEFLPLELVVVSPNNSKFSRDENVKDIYRFTIDAMFVTTEVKLYFCGVEYKINIRIADL